jgi:hypothetical protein
MPVQSKLVNLQYGIHFKNNRRCFFAALHGLHKQ